MVACQCCLGQVIAIFSADPLFHNFFWLRNWSIRSALTVDQTKTCSILTRPPLKQYRVVQLASLHCAWLDETIVRRGWTGLIDLYCSVLPLLVLCNPCFLHALVSRAVSWFLLHVQNCLEDYITAPLPVLCILWYQYSLGCQLPLTAGLLLVQLQPYNVYRSGNI